MLADDSTHFLRVGTSRHFWPTMQRLQVVLPLLWPFRTDHVFILMEWQLCSAFHGLLLPAGTTSSCSHEVYNDDLGIADLDEERSTLKGRIRHCCVLSVLG